MRNVEKINREKNFLDDYSLIYGILFPIRKASRKSDSLSELINLLLRNVAKVDCSVCERCVVSSY